MAVQRFDRRDRHVLALPAFRGVERNNVIARFERRHAAPDLTHDARAFVSQDCGKQALRICAGQRVRIGVTDSRCFDLYQHFARLRTFDLDHLDSERLAGLPGHRGTGLHALLSPVVPVFF
jgi:hypothetical protein